VVRLPEGHALAHQVLCQVSGQHVGRQALQNRKSKRTECGLQYSREGYSVYSARLTASMSADRPCRTVKNAAWCWGRTGYSRYFARLMASTEPPQDA
jgi:hypothetical protein